MELQQQQEHFASFESQHDGLTGTPPATTAGYSKSAVDRLVSELDLEDYRFGLRAAAGGGTTTTAAVSTASDDTSDHAAATATMPALPAITTGLKETAELKGQALLHLREAVDLLSPDKKAAYLEALDRVPAVVGTESPPICFLRREQFNVFFAARRLARYWTLRRKLFGSQRAHYPMRLTRTTLSGSGNDNSAGGGGVIRANASVTSNALCERDVEVLRSGAVALLPRDSHDRRVLYVDCSRLHGGPQQQDSNGDQHLEEDDSTIRARLRCAFFLLSTIANEDHEKQEREPHRQLDFSSSFFCSSSSSEDEQNKREGMVVICHVDRRWTTTAAAGSAVQPPPFDAITEPVEAFFAAFPIKFKALHVVCLDSSSNAAMAAAVASGRKHGMYGDTTSFGGGSSGSSTGIGSTIVGEDDDDELFPRSGSSSSHRAVTKVVHVSSSESEAFLKLKPHGLRKDGLPACSGGTWSFESFVKWVDQKQEEDSAAAATATAQAGGEAIMGDGAIDNVRAAERVVQDALVKEAEDWAVTNFPEAFDSAGRQSAKSVERTREAIRHVVTDVVTNSGNEQVDNSKTKQQRAAAAASGAAGSATAETATENEDPSQNRNIPYSEAWIRERQDRVMLEEALAAIPPEEKGAFIRARNEVPELVETESDPYRFLRVEDYDANRAARRLVKFWELRLDVFRDRAYRPLLDDLSGEGALDRRDLDVLQTGIAVPLPNLSDGTSVVLMDRSRLNTTNRHQLARGGDDDADAVLGTRKRRITFFLLALASQNDASQRRGILWLSRFVLTQRDPEYNRWLCDALATAVPVRTCTLLMCLDPADAEVSTMSKIILPVAAKLNSLIYSMTTEVLMCQTKDELAATLEGRWGFVRSGVPQCLGGAWCYDTFLRWLDEKRRGGGGKNQAVIAPSSAPRTVPVVRNSGSAAGSPPVAPPVAPPTIGIASGTQSVRQTLSSQSAGSLERRSQQQDEEAKEPAFQGNVTTVHDSETNRGAGSGGSRLPSTPERERAALRELHKALQLVPGSDKGSYLEAVRRCPYVLEKESNPIRFLRLDGFDAHAACRRLVSYWEKREFLFGGDRAFQALTQTGRGALSPHDLACLNTGFLVRLPNDPKGRPVLCCDAARLTDDDARESLLQILFYMFSVAMENDDACHEDGLVFLWLVSSEGVAENHKIGEWFQLCHDIFPISSWHVHVVPIPGRGQQRGLFHSSLRGLFRSVTEHAGKTKGELATMLEGSGIFEMRNIPTTVGGHWSYDGFTQWQRRRVLVERERYAPGGVGAAHAIPQVGSGNSTAAASRQKRGEHTEVSSFRGERDQKRQKQAQSTRLVEDDSDTAKEDDLLPGMKARFPDSSHPQHSSHSQRRHGADSGAVIAAVAVMDGSGRPSQPSPQEHRQSAKTAAETARQSVQQQWQQSSSGITTESVRRQLIQQLQSQRLTIESANQRIQQLQALGLSHDAAKQLVHSELVRGERSLRDRAVVNSALLSSSRNGNPLPTTSDRAVNSAILASQSRGPQAVVRNQAMTSTLLPQAARDQAVSSALLNSQTLRDHAVVNSALLASQNRNAQATRDQPVNPALLAASQSRNPQIARDQAVANSALLVSQNRNPPGVLAPLLASRGGTGLAAAGQGLDPVYQLQQLRRQELLRQVQPQVRAQQHPPLQMAAAAGAAAGLAQVPAAAGLNPTAATTDHQRVVAGQRSNNVISALVNYLQSSNTGSTGV